MATYNGAMTIERQLDSIVTQLSKDDEIIIVDDGSTDATRTLIKQYQAAKYPALKLIVNENNLGPIKSFEKALQLAQGDYIFLSDQDDIWNANKVESVMSAFDEGADLVVHDGVVVDGELNIIDKSWNHYNGNNVAQGLFGNLIKNGYTGAMMAISKRMIATATPFPEDISMHDQWLFVVAKMRHLKIVIIEEPLMQYVRHGNNATGMQKRKKSEMLSDRVKLLNESIKFYFNKNK